MKLPRWTREELDVLKSSLAKVAQEGPREVAKQLVATSLPNRSVHSIECRLSRLSSTNVHHRNKLTREVLITRMAEYVSSVGTFPRYICGKGSWDHPVAVAALPHYSTYMNEFGGMASLRQAVNEKLGMETNSFGKDFKRMPIADVVAAYKQGECLTPET